MEYLTEEQELELRRGSFAQIKPGVLFDVGGRRHFIACQLVREDEWEVIELDETNRSHILNRGECVRTQLHFNEMMCLNILPTGGGQ